MKEHPLLSTEANDTLRANTAYARVVVPNFVKDSMRPEIEERVRHQLHNQMAEFLRRERTDKRDLGDTTEFSLKLYVIDDATLYRLIQQEAMQFNRFASPVLDRSVERKFVADLVEDGKL